jgi:hypothetical protein
MGESKEVRKLFAKIDKLVAGGSEFKRPRTATSKQTLVKNILFTLPFRSAPRGVVHLMLIIRKLLIRSFYAVMDEDNPQPLEPETIWKWALARFMELASATEYSVRRYHLQFEAAKGEPPPCLKAPNRNIAPLGRYGGNGRLIIADALKKELEELGLQRYTIGRLSESESTEGKEDTDRHE